MSSTRYASTYAVYNKEKVLKELRNTEKVVLETLEDYNTKLDKWREEAPRIFSDLVKNYDPREHRDWYFRDSQYLPPKLAKACEDYRVKQLNSLIARFDMVEGDTLKIRNDDPCWNFIGNSECL